LQGRARLVILHPSGKDRSTPEGELGRTSRPGPKMQLGEGRPKLFAPWSVLGEQSAE
jgi:hypothetical protein